MNERETYNHDLEASLPEISPTHKIGNDDCACNVCTIIRDSGILPASGPVIDANERGKENHEMARYYRS